MKRGGKRYSALIKFRGKIHIVDDIRAHDAAQALSFVDKRRDAFFKLNQVPRFQQKTYRVLGLFYGSIQFATE